MPMTLPRLHRLPALCGALLTAGLLHGAQAAELGDASVKSYIGQPLAAEIELTALADPAAQVVVRNANADVYRGANIAINPALPSLSLTVQRRDGRQFVRASTSRAIDAAYLHLFLELVEGGKSNIRPVTLWLAQDPAPAPAPVLVPVPVPVPVPVAAPARPATLISAPPSGAAARSAAAPEPEAETPPARKPARVITLGSAPAAATEEKNRALTAQVAELEEKLRQLQAVVDSQAAPAPAAADAAASAPADPAAPVAASVASPDATAVSRAASALAAPAVPPPPKKPGIPAPSEASAEEAAPSGFPWLLVIGVMVALALVGGGVFFFLKRRKAAPAEAADSAEAAQPSLFSKLAARLRRNKPADEEAPAPAG